MNNRQLLAKKNQRAGLAAKAMQGLLSHGAYSWAGGVAAQAVELADALMAKLEEPVQELIQKVEPSTADDLADKLDHVLYEAVSSQYFGQSHKHRAHLYDIMRRIDPVVADAFDEDPERAYDMAAERIGAGTANDN